MAKRQQTQRAQTKGGQTKPNILIISGDDDRQPVPSVHVYAAAMRIRWPP